MRSYGMKIWWKFYKLLKLTLIAEYLHSKFYKQRSTWQTCLAYYRIMFDTNVYNLNNL